MFCLFSFILDAILSMLKISIISNIIIIIIIISSSSSSSSSDSGSKSNNNSKNNNNNNNNSNTDIRQTSITTITLISLPLNYYKIQLQNRLTMHCKLESIFPLQGN